MRKNTNGIQIGIYTFVFAQCVAPSMFQYYSMDSFIYGYSSTNYVYLLNK